MKTYSLERLKELLPGDWKQNGDFFWLENEQAEIQYTPHPISHATFLNQNFCLIRKSPFFVLQRTKSIKDVYPLYKQFFKLTNFK